MSSPPDVKDATFNFQAANGELGTTGGAGGTGGSGTDGSKGTSTGPDKHGNYSCTAQPGKGNPGSPGGAGSVGGFGQNGLDSPGGTLALGKVSGTITIKTGGGTGGKGGKGGPGGQGGKGGTAGFNPSGCTANINGDGGPGGKGGPGGQGGNGGNAGVVTVYFKSAEAGTTWNPIRNSGGVGLGGDPGDPGLPYPGTTGYPAGTGNEGQFGSGPNGTTAGQAGTIRIVQQG
jgi:hypothetical protein